uniref:SAP domain-containing protein n=1 Tax=uncultured marine group II/III euryarchaeote KM3_27_D02 TaxID=1456428 RepID=A0A075GYY8_9EURY|nr:hypothetical protein [uncultured marine group II/III euryarchaeote KM3_27_D02]
MIRKSQLIQSGVEVDDGLTLEEIVEEESRAAAELKAKKAAILEAAEAGEDGDDEDSEETSDDEEETSDDSESEPEPATEEAPEAEAEEAPEEVVDEDLSSLTVPELKEKLKAAGLPVSGKKAELIARLSE